jgi:WD repeat-containing protein 42A
LLLQVNCLEPHPHTPVLATSGLDHDVKVWSPSAPQPSSLEGLDEVIKRNCNEREDSMSHPVDGYEMLMQFIVRQYRRGIRRRIGATEESDSSSEDAMEGEEVHFEDRDSDSDEEGGPSQRLNCVQS